MARFALDSEQARFVRGARVARMATSSADGKPHVVPVCFELVRGRVCVGLDAKPKSVGALGLRRVKNILENPRASLVVDRYDEDWSRLGYVLIDADATLDMPETERAEAIRALRRKYPQYAELLPDDALVIRLTPLRAVGWGDLSPCG